MYRMKQYLPKLASVKLCTGCTACYASCYHEAIQMVPDELGFLQPKIDASCCIGCGLCERSCPVMQKHEPRYPFQCYAAKTKDKDLLLKSSSGGIFSEMAYKVLDNGGVVYGCILDKSLKAIHVSATARNDIDPMRGSKYVQSDLKNTYREAKQDLDAGKQVLFTGTPCQILGLKSFLRKSYDNLLTVGLICHGTPAPAIFEYYKHCEEKKSGKRLISFAFRSKHFSWREFAIHLDFGDKEKDKFISQCSGDYMSVFNRNYMMRESCFHCPARTGRSGCDIIIGDYWGIWNEHPEFDCDYGASCILIYSDAGLKLVSSLKLNSLTTEYAQVKRGVMNLNIENNPIKPVGLQYFRNHFSQRAFDDWRMFPISGPWYILMLFPFLRWDDFKNVWAREKYHKLRNLLLGGH